MKTIRENDRTYNRVRAYYLSEIGKLEFKTYSDEETGKIYWVFVDSESVKHYNMKYSREKIHYNMTQAQYDGGFKLFLNRSYDNCLGLRYKDGE